MKCSIIVAYDLSFGIGKNTTLPWHLSRDLKWFKQHTLGHTVIMGRNTWESLPEQYRPLPQRSNIVISRQADYNVPDGVQLACSLEDVLSQAGKEDQCFVIGGSQIYHHVMENDLCDKLYITQVYSQKHCDVYFPKWDLKNWRGLYASTIYVDAKVGAYQFKIYQKK